MNFTELTKRDGSKYLYDFDTGWEIYDKGDDKPAFWSNNREGRNMDASETYADLRTRLLPSCEPDPALLQKLKHVDEQFIAEIRTMPLHELQRRVLIQKDWLGSYSKCLDGLGIRNIGVESAWNPTDIRRAVESLKSNKA
jgi:hypothetical protein